MVGKRSKKEEKIVDSHGYPQHFTEEDKKAVQILVSMKHAKPEDKEAKNVHSAENLINGYNPPDLPPIQSLKDYISECSKPFEKQLTDSDVRADQNRLSLSKSHVKESFLPLLRDDENVKVGIPVTTYDMEGNEYPMMFKMWADKFYVLNGGWKAFYQRHTLQMHQDFVTVWMFRHSETNNLCFAISIRKLEVSQPVRRTRAI